MDRKSPHERSLSNITGRNGDYLSAALSINDLSLFNQKQKDEVNRHSKASILEMLPPERRKKHDFREKDDDYYQSLRATGGERFVPTTTKNPFLALHATTPTRRLFRQFQSPFDSNPKRSGFNIKLAEMDMQSQVPRTRAEEKFY